MSVYKVVCNTVFCLFVCFSVPLILLTMVQTTLLLFDWFWFQCTQDDFDYGTECLLLAMKYSGVKAKILDGGSDLWKVLAVCYHHLISVFHNVQMIVCTSVYICMPVSGCFDGIVS